MTQVPLVQGPRKSRAFVDEAGVELKERGAGASHRKELLRTVDAANRYDGKSAFRGFVDELHLFKREREQRLAALAARMIRVARTARDRRVGRDERTYTFFDTELDHVAQEHVVHVRRDLHPDVRHANANHPIEVPVVQVGA